MSDKKKQTHQQQDQSNQNPFGPNAFQAPQMDMNAMMNFYRKNMELMTQTQKVMVDMMKEMTALNADFSRQMLEESREHWRTLSHTKTLEEGAELNSEKARQGMEKVMHHAKQLGEMWSSSCSAVGEQFQSHMQEAFESAQQATQNWPAGSPQSSKN
jgi:phasin family protein